MVDRFLSFSLSLFWLTSVEALFQRVAAEHVEAMCGADRKAGVVLVDRQVLDRPCLCCRRHHRRRHFPFLSFLPSFLSFSFFFFSFLFGAEQGREGGNPLL
jgi:ABC-type transport system involved in cytochrome c biogenesis permease subunit